MATASSSESNLPFPSDLPPVQPRTIRVASFNIHFWTEGPPTPPSDTPSIGEVLKETKADIIALQEVQTLRSLDELAKYLGMEFAFAEADFLEFGNAVLSRYPIKEQQAEKIDVRGAACIRSILRTQLATPIGDLSFSCLHLDHVNEDIRLDQVSRMLKGGASGPLQFQGPRLEDHPHLLAGDFNSLKRADYTDEEWVDLVKDRSARRWEVPKSKVTELLLGPSYGYTDAETSHEQGHPLSKATSRFGTRIDYILASQGLDFEFVPGSYHVVDNKGASDHNLVIVDIKRRTDE